jgi:uncharacterized protein YrrD
MLKASQLIGKPILTLERGRPLGTVCRIIINPFIHQIAAFALDDQLPEGRTRVLPWGGVAKVHAGGVVAQSKKMIVELGDLFVLRQILAQDGLLRGMEFAMEDESSLGKVSDLFFEPKTGTVKGYELQSADMDDPNGEVARAFIIAPDFIEIGQSSATISEAAARSIIQLNGGIDQVEQLVKANEQSKSA